MASLSEPTVTYGNLSKDPKNHGKVTFSEILESADKMSLNEQETLIDVLQRRFSKHRRVELIKEIQTAQQEYQEGQCKAVTPSELMKEILS